MTKPPAMPELPDGATVLPDGSAFAIVSFPLPASHWLYAPHEYRDGEEDPIELPSPILSHQVHGDIVRAAIRYAVRSATMCGKESDFDPDALVQNAMYALCGPFGGAALQSAQPAEVSDAAVDLVGNELARQHAVYLTRESVRDLLARACLALRPAQQATLASDARELAYNMAQWREDARTHGSEHVPVHVTTIDKLVKHLRRLPAQQATPEPSRGMIGMGAHALANELAQAVAQDDADPDGHDMSAGLFGPNVSAWLRKISADYLPQPATPEPVQLDVVRQAIEERDAMESRYHELAKSMTYKGNSVAWWHSKATAYRNAIDEVWSALKAAGIYADGAKTCADGVRELAATPEPVGEPFGWWFTEDPAVFSMPGSGFRRFPNKPQHTVECVPLYTHAAQPVPMTCAWAEDGETGDYATTCGHVFGLNDGGPADNGMKFCCYCGSGITAQAKKGGA